MVRKNEKKKKNQGFCFSLNLKEYSKERKNMEKSRFLYYFAYFLNFSNT